MGQNDPISPIFLLALGELYFCRQLIHLPNLKSYAQTFLNGYLNVYLDLTILFCSELK